MYKTNIFVHLQIYHDKAFYNKENMACLKRSKNNEDIALSRDICLFTAWNNRIQKSE